MCVTEGGGDSGGNGGRSYVRFDVNWWVPRRERREDAENADIKKGAINKLIAPFFVTPK